VPQPPIRIYREAAAALDARNRRCRIIDTHAHTSRKTLGYTRELQVFFVTLIDDSTVDLQRRINYHRCRIAGWRLRICATSAGKNCSDARSKQE
jgi:hypothetical protein